MLDEIQEVLRAYAQLTVTVYELRPEDDLYQAGMTSHASVNVMLALEEKFDVEYPDRMLTRGSFATIANIQLALAELRMRS
jgi:acyl carrier protein